MQPLFSKGALGIEFKSLSPCWQSTGWWPLHQQEDMPRTELSLWERHLLITQGTFLPSALTCPMSVFSMSVPWPQPYVPWAHQRWATINWDPTGFWNNDRRSNESLKIWVWLVLSFSSPCRKSFQRQERQGGEVGQKGWSKGRRERGREERGKEDREYAQSSSFLDGKCEEVNENLF